MSKLANHHFRFDSVSLLPDAPTYLYGVVPALVVEYVCQRCGNRAKVFYDQGPTFAHGSCPRVWRNSN
jgi:hypothetical protein